MSTLDTFPSEIQEVIRWLNGLDADAQAQKLMAGLAKLNPNPTPSPDQQAAQAETPTPRTDNAEYDCRPWNGMVASAFARTLERELTQLRAENEKLRKEEGDLSGAYVRLRMMIPGALDTPFAPSGAQVWETTEKALAVSMQQLTHLKAELERANGILSDTILYLESHALAGWLAKQIRAHLNPKKTP